MQTRNPPPGLIQSSRLPNFLETITERIDDVRARSQLLDRCTRDPVFRRRGRSGRRLAAVSRAEQHGNLADNAIAAGQILGDGNQDRGISRHALASGFSRKPWASALRLILNAGIAVAHARRLGGFEE